MAPTDILAALVGLAVAFGGPALLVSPAQRLLGDPDRLATRLREQAALWINLWILLAVVFLLEGRSLSSIGVQPLRWSSFAWGVALAITLMFVVSPVAARAIAAAGFRGFESGTAKVASQPIGLRVFMVLTAAVVEEALFRGYAVERLAMITGSTLVAGILSATIAAVLHLPFWGIGPVLTFFVSGGLLTAFFIWSQDLLANIVAHALVDGVGLVLMPLLARVRQGEVPAP